MTAVTSRSLLASISHPNFIYLLQVCSNWPTDTYKTLNSVALYDWVLSKNVCLRRTNTVHHLTPFYPDDLISDSHAYLYSFVMGGPENKMISVQ